MASRVGNLLAAPRMRLNPRGFVLARLRAAAGVPRSHATRFGLNNVHTCAAHTAEPRAKSIGPTAANAVVAHGGVCSYAPRSSWHGGTARAIAGAVGVGVAVGLSGDSGSAGSARVGPSARCHGSDVQRRWASHTSARAGVDVDAALETDARDVFASAVQAALPGASVKRALRCAGNRLVVGGDNGGLTIDLKGKQVIIVGVGKASYPMTVAAMEALGHHVSQGLVITKYGHVPAATPAIAALPGWRRTKFFEAAHPVPDQAGVDASMALRRLLSQTYQNHVVVMLVSGGTSSLLCAPAAGLTLEHLQATSTALLSCGASINEINTVRKHLSSVKGGQLAQLAAPATVVTLVLSDVIGDPLDIIGSGPTVPDTSTFKDCVHIVEQYKLDSGPNALPAPVLARLRAGAAGTLSETPKPGDPIFARCHTRLVANNSAAVDAAASRARELGYNTLVLSTRVEGEAREVAKVHAAIAKEIAARDLPVAKPACIICGGETTVTIRGDGKGGRSQEMALAAAIELDGMPATAFLAGGTDGTDGPTDAAGAVVTGSTVAAAGAVLDSAGGGGGAAAARVAQRYLDRNDAWTYFERAGRGLVKTGPTGTNVMDVTVSLVADEAAPARSKSQ